MSLAERQAYARRSRASEEVMRDRVTEARSMVEEERVSKKELGYGASVCVCVCVCVRVCVCVCVHSVCVLIYGGGRICILMQGLVHSCVLYMGVFYYNREVYSGIHLLWTPWGPGNVSCIERCLGRFILRKHVWDIEKCP